MTKDKEKFNYLNEKIGRFFGYALFLTVVSFIFLAVIINIFPVVFLETLDDSVGLAGLKRLYLLVPAVCLFIIFSLVKIWKSSAAEDMLKAVIDTFIGILKFLLIASVGLAILWYMLVGGVTDIINIFKSPQPATMLSVATSLAKIVFAFPVAWFVTYFIDKN